MQVIRGTAEVRQLVRALQRQDRTLGMVPTMGFLHAGHANLIEAAVAESDEAVVTIFVNPTQFGPQEDLSRYPRDLERDLNLCQARGVRWVFVPDTDELYPRGTTGGWTQVCVPETLTRGLCGAWRPGHFIGVATVVAKLFALWQPQRAYFGLKDFQQTAVLRAMVQDLLLPVELRLLPTVREADGLALSSRNVYLSVEERQQSLVLVQALQAGWLASRGPDATPEGILAAARRVLEQEPGWSTQYLELVDADSLEPIETMNRPGVLALAGFIGRTRLIDNVFLGGPAPLDRPAEQAAGSLA
ncbi:MAG: pantoate--beta-alanine ligase [Candidatus Sericytochromatia bacterium]|nr:pantoate--beta-alanine ligase [Candidatus Sericytochromatia bacterium]